MGVLLQFVSFHGRETFGVGANSWTVGAVEVAGVEVAVRVVPQTVGFLEVLSQWSNSRMCPLAS